MEVAEVINKDHLQVKLGLISEMVQRRFGGDFSTPSVKHISDFFMYLYQDLNNHPLDGWKERGGHIRYNQVFRSLIPGSRYRFQDVTGKVIFKRPARDACLCMGELPAPPAPHFVFLITL